MATRRDFRVRLECEGLEARELFATNITLSDGVVSIRGTSGADRVTVRQRGSRVVVQMNGPGRDVKVFRARSVRQVLFQGGRGKDTLVNSTDVATRALGGSGDDFLEGGGGDDFLDGGDGDDVLDGGGGNDSLFGGDGEDELIGENGNDFLEGGFGNDMLGGGLGSDMLNGGAGTDVVRGGGGGTDTPINWAGDQVSECGMGPWDPNWGKTTQPTPPASPPPEKPSLDSVDGGGSAWKKA